MAGPLPSVGAVLRSNQLKNSYSYFYWGVDTNFQGLYQYLVSIRGAVNSLCVESTAPRFAGDSFGEGNASLALT